jgi:hypothetical protein
VSEHTFEYGDRSHWFEVDEQSGSQTPPLGSPEFEFDQTAFAELLMRAVRDQLTQNEDLVTDARQYLPRSDTQMMQVFEEFGLTRSGTEILEPEEDIVHDSFSGSAIFESSQDDEPLSPDDYGDIEIDEETEDEVPYEGYDGGPLEFDTMDEAREYAARVSYEILDEILEELSREHLGESGVVDMTFDDMERLSREMVFPEVWQLMDD